MGQPAGLERAVWAAGEVESHNGILFDNALPGWNIGVRPEPGDRIQIKLNQDFFTGRHKVIACVGFLGGGGNTVDVTMKCHLEEMNFHPPQAHLYPDQAANLVDPVGGLFVQQPGFREQPIQAGGEIGRGRSRRRHVVHNESLILTSEVMLRKARYCSVAAGIGKGCVLLVQFDQNDYVKRFEVTKRAMFESYGDHLIEWVEQSKEPTSAEVKE